MVNCIHASVRFPPWCEAPQGVKPLSAVEDECWNMNQFWIDLPSIHWVKRCKKLVSKPKGQCCFWRCTTFPTFSALSSFHFLDWDPTYLLQKEACGRQSRLSTGLPCRGLCSPWLWTPSHNRSDETWKMMEETYLIAQKAWRTDPKAMSKSHRTNSYVAISLGRSHGYHEARLHGHQIAATIGKAEVLIGFRIYIRYCRDGLVLDKRILLWYYWTKIEEATKRCSVLLPNIPSQNHSAGLPNWSCDLTGILLDLYLKKARWLGLKTIQMQKYMADLYRYDHFDLFVGNVQKACQAMFHVQRLCCEFEGLPRTA